MTSHALPQRRRSPVTLLERNRGLIIDAVVGVLADEGWSGMAFTSVARRAGLSARPVQDRFPDRWALAIAAWDGVVGAALGAALTELLASCGLASPDGSTTPAPLGDGGRPAVQAPRAAQAVPAEIGGLRERLSSALHAAGFLDPESGRADPSGRLQQALQAALAVAQELDHDQLRAAGPSARWLARALEPFVRPGPALRAATEILVVSQFHPALRERIQAGLGATVAAWCDPANAAGDHQGQSDAGADAARRAYLVAIALGLLLARTRAGVADLDMSVEAQSLIQALTAPPTSRPMPSERAEHLERFLDFDTGDAALDALLRATLEEVGRVGYDAATTAGIGRASGYSEGLIFARYPSKVELFMDATRRQHAQGWRLNEAFTQVLEAEHGPGAAEAVLIREFQRPDLEFSRSINLEQVRLALHDERLRDMQWGELDALIADEQAKDPNWQAGISPAHVHVSVAIGIGATALPILAPEAWQLPFQVVTIPLNEPGANPA